MKEVGKPFNNIKFYNTEMSLAMEDKLFFVDKIPENSEKGYLIVDFGCADGTMINHLEKVYPKGTYFIGYDISESMIELAKSRSECDPRHTMYTTSWDTIVDKLNEREGKISVLILSSVIHEVYSYGTQESIKVFWNRILSSRFDYIVVRDMMPGQNICRPADELDVYKVMMWNKHQDRDYVSEYESVFGKITDNRNLVHFLLKYRWKINWEREVHENYFPINLDQFFSMFQDTYSISYLELFRVKFIEEKIIEDFDIYLKDTTHIKAIFNLKRHEKS